MKGRKTWMGQRKEGGAHSIQLRSCFGPFPPPPTPSLFVTTLLPSPSFLPPKIAKKSRSFLRVVRHCRFHGCSSLGSQFFSPSCCVLPQSLGARLACFWRCPKLFCRKGDARLIFGPRLMLRTSCSEPHTVRAGQKNPLLDD